MIDARDGWFFVSTRHTSYIMKVGEAGHLEHVHYGGYIPSDAEGLGCIQGPDDIRIGDGTYYDEEHQHTLLARKLLEYSAPGKGDTRESAVIAEYRNGLITLDPLFRSFRIYEGKDYPVLPAVSGEGASTLEITLRDAVLPIDIILRYSAYEEEDVIVRSAEIRNGKEISVETVSIRDLPFLLRDDMGDVWLYVSKEKRIPLPDGLMANGNPSEIRKWHSQIVRMNPELRTVSPEKLIKAFADFS